MVLKEDQPKADGPRAQKVQQVEELSKEAQESNAVIFADYRGLTVSETSQLRKNLAEIGADFKVAKNTLLKFALEKAKLPEVDLQGPTAVLFSRTSDPLESIKTLVTFFKAKEKGEVKVGFWERSLVAADRILALAAVPAKQVLQARLVSQLSSPIYKLSYILSSQRTKLVVALNQIAKSRGGVS